MRALFLATWTIALIFGVAALAASDLDEFKIKRQELFEFARKPHVTRSGDRVEIFFESKGFCDATVAIEDAERRIVRHLASGVLGPKAPEPFQAGSLKQTLVWDGKDDQGIYLDIQESLTVRVSLGLKPRFERNLLWSPKKRITSETPLVQAAEEGVYVYDGDVVDHVRFFDHQGNYVRTIYPFPADKMKNVQGLKTQIFPQDGKTLPLKEGFFQATFLTCGPNAGEGHGDGSPGKAAVSMAVQQGRIALLDYRLNRLARDGTTGGLPLSGPSVARPMRPQGWVSDIQVGPLSAAFSPDGKRLYLTGYVWKVPTGCWAIFYALPLVMKLDFEGQKDAELFLGSLNAAEAGKENGRFNMPSSVACDAQGRVYVADFMNDRVQVFSPEGKHLQNLAAVKPAQICFHHRTQELYVFSWALPNSQTELLAVNSTLTVFGPFPDLKKQAAYDLPVPFYEAKFYGYGGTHMGYGHGQPVQVTLDSWTDPPTLWLAREPWPGGYRVQGFKGGFHEAWGIRRLALQDGKFKELGNFGSETRNEAVTLRPAPFHRQRLYVRPKDGMLYVAEHNGSGHCKATTELLKLHPETGKLEVVPVPFSAEDFAFDLDGHLYMRTNKELVRYNPETWREVPFDYGEELQAVGYTADGMGYKYAPAISALPLPAPGKWHHGGLWVSPQGHIAVSCFNNSVTPKRDEPPVRKESKVYTPRIYPGRLKYGEIHIWNKQGQLIHEDTVKGLGILNGLALDPQDNLYVLEAADRVLDGTPYFNGKAGTLLKFPAKRGKIISSAHAEVPLSNEEQPRRPPDLTDASHGKAWVEEAEWKYGGVGFGGKNPGTGCACWNCRFTLDYFNRSWVPELDHFSVAVLDSNGNLILRLGQYGNVDSAGPGSLVPLGGDEIGLVHAAYVATHTDRRLFISDAGNERIVSARLGYQAEEKVALKDVPDEAAAKR